MQEIFQFLTDLTANNNREWFRNHRERYDAAAARFNAFAEDVLQRVVEFEPACAHLRVKDTLYRIYRDTRFSPDKSPYKRHLGSYINPLGKKSLHGGYYFHIEPGHCLVAVGSYGLPSDTLRAIRWSIVANPDRLLKILAEPELAALRPTLGENHLKTLPAGFPRDFAHPELLRPREYDLWAFLPDELFLRPDAAAQIAHIFKLMKPYNDFINETVDDYI